MTPDKCRLDWAIAYVDAMTRAENWTIDEVGDFCSEGNAGNCDCRETMTATPREKFSRLVNFWGTGYPSGKWSNDEA